MEERGWRAYGALIFVCLVIGAGFWMYGFTKKDEVVVPPTTNTQTRPEPVSQTEKMPEFVYEIVTTKEQHAQGLSGRAFVPENYGMLFVFDAPDRYGFWMKDMLVSIDMIWLSDNGTILGIEEAVSPDTYPTPFYPPSPVRYVLETRAYEAYRQGWGIGTRLMLPAPYGSR